MELLQLKYFCHAAKSENLSETARHFFVPTSNISQSIKRLEGELGCELFDHRANKIFLNAQGKQFYTYAAEALRLLHEGQALATDTESVHGEIRLACLSNRKNVTLAIEKFVRKYPGVSFSIHHTVTAESVFDILISDICPFEYGRRELLLSEKILLAVNKTNPLAHKSDLSIADLANERFMSMAEGSSMQRLTVSICAEAGFSPNIVIQTDDPTYVRKYAEMGLGIAFVPAISWSGLFSENIVLRQLDGLNRNIHAFFPKNRSVSRATEAFFTILKEEMSTKHSI